MGAGHMYGKEEFIQKGLQATTGGKNERRLIQKGFLMKDRLLRPSLVAVSKKTTKEEDNKEKNVIIEEGCLSLPQYFAEIKRPASIEIEYIDENIEYMDEELEI